MDFESLESLASCVDEGIGYSGVEQEERWSQFESRRIGRRIGRRRKGEEEGTNDAEKGALA